VVAFRSVTSHDLYVRDSQRIDGFCCSLSQLRNDLKTRDMSFRSDQVPQQCGVPSAASSQFKDLVSRLELQKVEHPEHERGLAGFDAGCCRVGGREMKLRDWWPAALFALVMGAGLIFVSQSAPDNPFHARESDPSFLSVKGWACKRYFTHSEWSRLTSALSGEHIENATCREMTAMLPANNVESAAGDCGARCSVAGEPFNEQLIGPSSGAWGRRPGEYGRLAYFTTDGGTTSPPPDRIVRPAKVLRVEF
jgi:hypothetical protein